MFTGSLLSSYPLQLKDNPTLTNFFQRMTYSSFQMLADAYLEKEATPTHNPPTVLPTAPELVKLAFTYDFTAKIARLSKQNVGHITGLGNRYLQERFEYKQVRIRTVCFCYHISTTCQYIDLNEGSVSVTKHNFCVFFRHVLIIRGLTVTTEWQPPYRGRTVAASESFTLSVLL